VPGCPTIVAKARYDETALHILALKDSTPIGTVRLLHPPVTDKFKLGRLAVRKIGRGGGIAQILVAELDIAAKEMGAKEVYAGSQVPVRRLYEKSGYQAIGEEYLDEGQPHIMMVKSLM
jgi:predicted GNAT family N-acyltransferase